MTTQHLKNKFQDDTTFRTAYEKLMKFYLMKFILDEANNNSIQNRYLDEIELVLNRQFLQGYMVVQQFLESNPELPLITENTTFYDVLNTVPTKLNDIFAEQDLDFVQVDTSEAFAMEMLTEIGITYYDMLQQVYKEITYYGITYALLHHYSEYIADETASDITDIVQPYMITPQLSLIPTISLNGTADALKFELFSCSFPGQSGTWMGRVSYNPYSSTEKIVEVLLSDRIAAFEKTDLLTTLSPLLSSDESLYLNVFHISSIQTLAVTEKNTD